MDGLWHILRVTPGIEEQVASRSGVPAYVPRRQEEKYVRRQRKVVRRVVTAFPGYVFLRLDCPSKLRVPPRRGVFGFLRNNDKSPAVLTERAFSQMVAQERESLRATTGRPQRPNHVALKSGDAVRVVSPYNALVGALGVVEKNINGRVVLDVVGSSARFKATVAEEDLMLT